MIVSADIEGLDEFLEDVRKDIQDGMFEAAKAGVDYAKEKGSYKNHTYNLRNAPGAAVVMDGKIVDTYIPSDSNHAKAHEKTENLLIYGNRPENGIIIADGMEYASFVEARKYDVISGGSLVACSEAVNQFEK